MDVPTYLIIVDAYTKWVEVYEMSTCTSPAVIDKLYEFMARFGLPHTIVTDNGTSFSSHEFIHFCKLNGISRMTSPPYHPASNGQAESYVKIIKRGIRSVVQTSKSIRESRLKLLKYVFDYRNSSHSTTGESPAQLVFSRQLRSRLDLMSPRPPAPSSAPSSASLHMRVRSKQCLLTERRGGKFRTFYVEQDVFYKKYLNNNKFIWLRGKIHKNLGKMLYVVKDYNSLNYVKKHRNQLILYNKGTGSNMSNHSSGDRAVYTYNDNEIVRSDSTSISESEETSLGEGLCVPQSRDVSVASTTEPINTDNTLQGTSRALAMQSNTDKRSSSAAFIRR
ncbi:uncharacterized protein K02A2.6-like [Ostrinia furnacalis]|uniref:uncharacterized protein K02A2.6-like n=1 Tax=Ostrinia furnacalis TaxID=93504 RepID=UPI001039D8D2|nr:uncharacterized protein K02A2.6-like [Ostrinia furnacalis]